MFYFGLGGGLGMDRHQISLTNVEGYSILFPTIRLGFQKSIGESYSFLIEGVTEHVRKRDSFSQFNVQDSSILNVKLAVGLKF